jgi:hypothetical protein
MRRKLGKMITERRIPFPKEEGDGGAVEIPSLPEHLMPGLIALARELQTDSYFSSIYARGSGGFARSSLLCDNSPKAERYSLNLVRKTSKGFRSEDFVSFDQLPLRPFQQDQRAVWMIHYNERAPYRG